MYFSIILPVYNAEKFLRDCLESIDAQTYKNYEVIAVNDGSTDSSKSILEEYAKKNNRIRIFNCENHGVTSARKRGIANSNGEYLLLIDADDTVNPELLSHVKETVEKFPHIDLVRFKAYIVNDKEDEDHELYNTTATPFNALISGVEAINAWTKSNKRFELFWLYAVKREKMSLMESCPDLRTAGDYGFIPVLVANCENIVMIDYVGYNYTMDNKSSLSHEIGHDAARRKAQNFLKAYNYLMDQIKMVEEKKQVSFDEFHQDWRRRLKKRYKFLDDDLKLELKEDFDQAFQKA